MPFISLGDQTQHFQSLRQTGTLKRTMAELGHSLTSGQANDLTEHLAGKTQGLAGIDHNLEILNAYQATVTETEARLDISQRILGRVGNARTSATDQFLTINANSGGNQLALAGNLGRASFEDAIAAINLTASGKTNLAGTETSGRATETSDVILSDLVTSIAGATDATSIKQAVSDWFLSPTGGYMTQNYEGSTAALVQRQVSADAEVSLNLRADDYEVREILAGLALGAVVAELGNALTSATSGELYQEAGIQLVAASASQAALEVKVGQQQSRLSEIGTRLSAEQSSMAIARNNMIAVDPFETASRLQSVQQQLEMHFAVTARLSRLSLANYI